MKNIYNKFAATIFAGLMLGSQAAHASGGAPTNNFGNIASNITDSVADLPGLLSAMSYLFGILLGVLGVMKIKDHVENPSNTPLKDGAIRLAAGGALFALPIISEAMATTIGSGNAVSSAQLNKVTMGISGGGGTTP